MTIAQIQGLQAFVMNQLSDIIDWGRHVRPELDRYPKDAEGKPQLSGDVAHVLITTPFNRYRMSICSSYIEPPPGAPVACRSLGTVTFHDLSDNKHIVGPKSDQTRADISMHIHVREYTDALAAVRREIAEAGPETAGSARVKLADLAERAKKWGIAAKAPEAPSLAADNSLGIERVERAQEFLRSQHDPAFDGSTPASRDAPWLGAPVMFITNPGEQIGGMQEIVGWCVKVYSHDRISIFMTPDHSEPSYRDNLPRRGSPAGNGRVHQFNCWDFNVKFMDAMKGDKLQVEQHDFMYERFEGLLKDIGRIEHAMNDFVGRLIALEGDAPKRRGRPPKAEGEKEDRGIVHAIQEDINALDKTDSA